MRALRRIATPAGLGLALVGCSFNVDEFQAPKDNGNGTPLVGNTDAQSADAQTEETTSTEASTDGANDTASVAADTALAVDTGADACVCVKWNGSGTKCKEYSPPGCM